MSNPIRSSGSRCGYKSGDLTERQTRFRFRLVESKKSKDVDVLTGSLFMGFYELVFLANLPRILLDVGPEFKDEVFSEEDYRAPCYVITKIAKPREELDHSQPKSDPSDLSENQTTIHLKYVPSKKKGGNPMLIGSYYMDKAEVVLIVNLPKVLLEDPPEGKSDADFFGEEDYTASAYAKFKIARPRQALGSENPEVKS